VDSEEKPDRILIRDLVDRISKATADRHPEKWQHDTDPIVRTIVETMNADGWEPGGIPGVLQFVCTEIGSGRIQANSDFNDLPCGDVSLIRADPVQWYVTREAENHIWQALANAVERAPELAREKRELRAEQYEKQRVAKKAAGRYTLEEAAALVATNAGEPERDVLALLLNAVNEGKVVVHKPGRTLPYRPTTVSKFYEEVYWDDLNAWLNGINFRKPWRFPPPNTEPKAASRRPKLKSQYHDEEIMRVVGELGWKPLALPNYGPGKNGARGIIREKLPHLTDAQFKHSWDRLTAEPKRIGYAD